MTPLAAAARRQIWPPTNFVGRVGVLSAPREPDRKNSYVFAACFVFLFGWFGLRSADRRRRALCTSSSPRDLASSSRVSALAAPKLLRLQRRSNDFTRACARCVECTRFPCRTGPPWERVRNHDCVCSEHFFVQITDVTTETRMDKYEPQEEGLDPCVSLTNCWPCSTSPSVEFFLRVGGGRTWMRNVCLAEWRWNAA